MRSQRHGPSTSGSGRTRFRLIRICGAGVLPAYAGSWYLDVRRFRERARAHPPDGGSTTKSMIEGSSGLAMRHVLRHTCPAKSHTQGHTRRPLPNSWDRACQHFCGVWVCRHEVHTSWCLKEPHQLDGHTGRKSDHTTDQRPPTPPGTHTKVRRTREWSKSGCRAQTSHVKAADRAS